MCELRMRITLPMRDWDKSNEISIGGFFLWITLPMRDWDETFIKTVCIADTMDYITYEGLRHFRCEGKCWVYWKMGLHYLWGIETEDFWSSNPLPSIGLHYLWGIETNLSRLICPCGDINGLHYLWGIETIKFLLSLDSVKLSRDYITYEGLRLPEFHLEQRKYKFVQLRITLPMRDWDIPPYESFIIIDLRITLPMRDWDVS